MCESYCSWCILCPACLSVRLRQPYTLVHLPLLLEVARLEQPALDEAVLDHAQRLLGARHTPDGLVPFLQEQYEL